MNKDYKFNLNSAILANKNNTLLHWVNDFLNGEGRNHYLADIIKDEKLSIIKLVEFPISKLKRNMGPEENMKFSESSEKWEERVEDLIKKIKEGKEFPPLIVTDFWSPLTISDGSHRHEAFLRSGYNMYWTIFLFKDEKSLVHLEIPRLRSE